MGLQRSSAILLLPCLALFFSLLLQTSAEPDPQRRQQQQPSQAQAVAPRSGRFAPVKRNVAQQQRSAVAVADNQQQGERKKRCEDGGCDDGGVPGDFGESLNKPGIGPAGPMPNYGNGGGGGKGIMCKCMCDGLPIDADKGSGSMMSSMIRPTLDVSSLTKPAYYPPKPIRPRPTNRPRPIYN